MTKLYTLQRIKQTQKQENKKIKKEKNNSRIKSKSSFDNIDGVVVFGLKSPIITFSDCFIDLHIFTASSKKKETFLSRWVFVKTQKQNH